MGLLVLSEADVHDLLETIRPQQAMSIMLGAFQCLSSSNTRDLNSQAQSPHRSSIQSPYYSTLFMPSRLPSSGTAIKVVSIPKAGSTEGLPASIMLLDDTTGATRAVMNAKELTAFRTAAGSALATDLLRGDRPPPKRIVFYGGGLQVAHHAQMLLHQDMYRSSVESVTLINRSDNNRFRSIASTVNLCAPAGVPIEVLVSNDERNASAIQSAVQSADLIGCTATSSTLPLFPASWVKDGTHINLVGSYTPEMQEVSGDLIKRASLILVDSVDACRAEAGELIRAGWDDIKNKVMEIRAFSHDGTIRPRITSRDITIFKSVGVGVQDVALAALVTRLAEEGSIGTTIPF